MSVLFPHINKPRKWDYRPIYYDPKKDEMDQKLAKLQAKRAAEEARLAKEVQQASMLTEEEKTAEIAALEAKLAALKGETTTAQQPYAPTLHRGSFREARENGEEVRRRGLRKSNLILWVVLLALLVALMLAFEPIMQALGAR